MTKDELKQASKFLADIEAAEKQRADYSKGEKIIVTVEEQTSRFSPIHPGTSVVFTAAEIGDAVVAALDRRIAKMKAELKDLGIEEG